jgi:hypothetical protein
MNLIIFLFIYNSLTTTSAMQQEFYRAMVFPITSTAYQTTQKAETKLVCASKCLYMSTNCSVFFFDLKKKSCIVTQLEQLSSANNSLETVLGYVSIGKLSFLSSPLMFFVCPFGYLYFHNLSILIDSITYMHQVYSVRAQTEEVSNKERGREGERGKEREREGERGRVRESNGKFYFF